MYTLENFDIREFVPKSIYSDRGIKAVTTIDVNLLIFIDHLREYLDLPITINDYIFGGNNQFRGLRTIESKDYSKYSQHSFGRALDFDVKGMTAQEVRQWIIKNRNLWWVKPITFIENNVGWVHIDTRATDNYDLILYDVNTEETIIFKR